MLVATVLGVLLVPAPARAEEPRPGLLRVAHLSPDTPAVDVSVTPAAADPAEVLLDPGPVVAPALAYGDVGGYREVPPGISAVSVRGAGAFTAPVLSMRVDVAPGQVRTVVLGGAFADLTLFTVDDDLAPPPAGSARVRVLAAASEPTVDVSLAGGPVLAAGLRPDSASDAVVVPGGRYGAVVTGGSGKVPLEFPAGSVVTVLVLDAPGGTTLRTAVDATGPAVRPVGGVAAGGRPRLPGSALSGVIASLSRAGSTAVRDAAADTDPVAAPVRLRLPSAGIDAVLTTAGLDGAGALLPPADPALAGWFSGGPRPGAPGPAVIAGHVDWGGSPGALSGLVTAAVGNEVVVDRADGTVARFRVTAVDSYAKDAFPTDRVYGPTTGPELRLITCGGPFDGENYRDNVVVSARLVG
ncbi:DUF4397 domain-containing protein [Blastococcus sp. LR1]|uniref:DUF4397 domain-containing protein n=1 Tax=Blastococcus sp. LR1 TaxID=2877000 RepID=UPI001CCA5DBD|nr:DUF4397 domain-containing protein [Blastococcus sp. LR1]MCA0146423.1 DUF4397 domain-containing protein [Blastococcus sp. LR1]